MREEREGSREPRGNAGRTSGETDGGGGVPVARIRGGARSRAAEPAEHPERRACESAREGEVRGVALFWESPGHPPGSSAATIHRRSDARSASGERQPPAAASIAPRAAARTAGVGWSSMSAAIRARRWRTRRSRRSPCQPINAPASDAIVSESSAPSFAADAGEKYVPSGLSASFHTPSFSALRAASASAAAARAMT